MFRRAQSKPPDSPYAKNGELPIKNRRYGVILADPPWSFENYSAKGHAKSPHAHYRCIDYAELKLLRNALALDFICAPDAVLVLWATFPMLPAAFNLMLDWGFGYRTGGAWVKTTAAGSPAMGTGYIYRSAAEPWLLGARGAPEILDRGIRNAIATVSAAGIEAPRREHSRKPDDMYDMIEREFNGPYLELFARRARAGWTVWGDQIEQMERKS